MIAARFGYTLVLQTLKSLMYSWSCSLRIPQSHAGGSVDTGHFDGKNVMIVSDRASDLLESVMRHILHSDVQSLIVVSPDVSAFLLQVWRHLFPDDDQVQTDCRLFFQPNELRDKEKVDTFVDNLRQNGKLRLHHVLLLTGDEEGEEGRDFPVQHLVQRLQQANLLLPQSEILITSPSVSHFFTMYRQYRPDVRIEEMDDMRLKYMYMLIGKTSRISINNIPRLVSCHRIFLFLQQWLSFLAEVVFAMNPDYISAIIIDAFGSQTSDSFFIYGKAVK